MVKFLGPSFLVGAELLVLAVHFFRVFFFMGQLRILMKENCYGYILTL